MILGVGIDAVDIARFAPWTTIAPQRLARIFSAPEIAYCLQSSSRSAEHFAVRFAAREACFKALSSLLPNLPFLTLCRAICITQKPSGAPELTIDWDFLARKGFMKPSASLIAHLSLSHTRSLATAIVLLESLPEKANS